MAELQELLDKYARVRETIVALEDKRRDLETVIMNKIEYGSEPIFWDDYRIVKTMKEKWTFPEWVENRREEASEYMAKMRKSMKRVEREAIDKGEAEKEEVYGIQFSIKGRKAR